jgi:hypothetical protein
MLLLITTREKKMARKSGGKSKSDLSIVSQQSDSEVSDDELEDISSSGDEVDETALNISTSSTPRPQSVTLEVPRSLSRCLSTTSDGRHLSVRDQSAIQKSFLASANVNPSLVSISKSTVHRQRRINRTLTAAEIKESFISNLSPFGIVHFDSKLIR